MLKENSYSKEVEVLSPDPVEVNQAGTHIAIKTCIDDEVVRYSSFHLCKKKHRMNLCNFELDHKKDIKYDF